MLLYHAAYLANRISSVWSCSILLLAIESAKNDNGLESQIALRKALGAVPLNSWWKAHGLPTRAADKFIAGSQVKVCSGWLLAIHGS